MENELYNLSNSQMPIWMIEKVYPNTNINCMGGSLVINEKVNFNLLEKAFNLTLQKHDALRTRIIIKNDVTMQYYAEFEYEKYKTIKISKKDFDDKIKLLSPKPFDILASKLYDFSMYEFEDGTGAIVVYLHHLICDAWATSIFTRTIIDIYHNLANNQIVDEINYPSYVDHIQNDLNYKNSKRFLDDKEYWENKLKDVTNVISLKKDTQNISTNFTRKIFNFSCENVLNFCKSNNESLPSFLLSIYSLYFSKLLENDNFIIGTPVLNRGSFSEKQTMGIFISTVPNIIPYIENESFIDRLNRISSNQKTLYRHLKYPFENISKYLKSEKNISEKLYDIVFSYQNAHTVEEKTDITWIPSNNQLESLMIHITDLNGTGDLQVNYDYQSSVFDEKQIDILHNRILNIINSVIEKPNKLCKDIEILSNEEKNILLNDFINTSSSFSKKTIIKEFENGVMAHPDSVALTFADAHYTYNELNNAANQLALELKNNNVNENDIVGILLPRSAEIIISILAILKVGATYMPIEPEYPSSRVSYMIENSTAKLIITTNTLKKNITTDAKLLLIENLLLDKDKQTDNLSITYNPDSLAYIMYTSGTTGLPKAVMIRNYSVINFAYSMKKRLDYSSSSENKVLSVTTMCFDIFVFEVFPTLIFGLHLVIANEQEQKSPILLSALIEKENICKILTTPSRIQLLFLDSKYLKCLDVLKEIILGGEPFPNNFIHDLPKYTNARIFNLYGPTETTVYSTFKELTHENEITIGKPIENTTIYILDKNKKILPIGQTGELYIGGLGVAKGYYKNEELTNEKFVNNPYNNGEIIYNTGDLAKWLPNGELICLGRIDNQIKIRGYRIELGDIESHILNFKGIKKVVVTDKVTPDGKKFLCAYFISETDISTNELRKYLFEVLPNYMIPSCYVRLNEFPLTPNHKIDRKALPTPDFALTSEEEYVAPSNETEKILCNIIEKVLDISKLGINDDIFSYSADSLTIIQIQTLLIPYGYNLKTQDFYKLRTIKNFANHLANSSATTNELPKEDKKLYSINSLFKKHSDDNLKVENCINHKGYFLTGVTGYLGIHVLNELLNSTSANIYCAVRVKNDQNAIERINDTWNYYFPNQEIDLDRVHIIDCDLTKDNFALSHEDISKIANNVSSVINCAANVKYYGDYSNHELINVIGVKNIIKFCKEYSIYFYQISTTGVSGNYLVSQNKPNTVFTENDFYIGQNYKENVYINSKFEAEKLIYETEKLKYSILRVGNLTARISDGVFQKNKEENAFYNILKFIAINKIVPNGLVTQSLEFTPVDLCAKAIVLLTTVKNIESEIFHIYNENTITVTDFINMLKSKNILVNELNSDLFNQKILALSQDEASRSSLKAVINDLDSKNGLSFMPSVIINNNISNKMLESLNFNWPIITFEYINSSLNLLLEEK